jgi:secreted trypsin-like serine protease
MHLIVFSLWSVVLLSLASAMVGGAPAREDGIGRGVVTIVGSRGNFCSGALIAPDLVLSAAHCVLATFNVTFQSAVRTIASNLHC